jgi:hypothetical protein
MATLAGPAQIGIIGGVMPWINVVSQPAWGAFADKIRTRKAIALVRALHSTWSTGPPCLPLCHTPHPFG